ncbi:hypothetical protein ABENE_08100 [Asticcacaulis benevestitus DSM 16100 = ATCC BAA-896]|uniref:Uncharacterized protein n=1 Tax=Asticcacaulis benevestitus DSM 16100 = ATCC BAA-896 TaxID=1121022 RepID=V4Q464_9CAUL|nr:hypothetical protein ABENE_08100 [Asticcacaulis benevestitus DSM 16100 = ATCC BAA-896]
MRERNVLKTVGYFDEAALSSGSDVIVCRHRNI